MSRRLGGRFACLVLALVLAVTSCPAAAWADQLVLSGEDSLALAAIDIVPLPVECSPESIWTGVSCGMTEMCGQDPCLCGAVDGWGACACNGTSETRPAWALSLGGDAGNMVHLLRIGDRMYVVSFGLGGTSADGVLSASLVHYGGAKVDLHVDVAPFGVLDLLKVVVALGAIAGLFAAVSAGLRALVEGVAKAWRRRGGKHGESRFASAEGLETNKEV